MHYDMHIFIYTYKLFVGVNEGQEECSRREAGGEGKRGICTRFHWCWRKVTHPFYFHYRYTLNPCFFPHIQEYKNLKEEDQAQIQPPDFLAQTTQDFLSDFTGDEESKFLSLFLYDIPA